MKKKPPKKNEPTPEYDPLRQQNVLLEKIHSEVKTIAEGHSGLDRKMDKTNERMDEMSSDLQMIKNKVVEHDKRFERIEVVVTENRKDIKELKIGQEELKVDVSQLKTGQEELKTGQEELKTDVNHLKSDVKRIEQKLDTVTQNHEQRIQKLETVH